MSFFSELSPDLGRRTPQELMQWFTDAGALAQVPKEDRQLLLDEVAVRIAESGATGFEFLLANLAGAEEAPLCALLLGLSFASQAMQASKQAEIRTLVRNFLDDARPGVIAQALDTLRHLHCDDLRDDVARLLNHVSPVVVGSALRYMAHRFPEEAIPILEQSLESPEPLVRENAVDELDELGCVTALPKIRPLLQDPDEHVRQAARTAVANLEDDLDELRQAI